jgi:hypothetical protein
LYVICREWELTFNQEVRIILHVYDTPEMRAYLDGLEFQRAGN